jgi:uncharacterized protein with PIN domain
MSQASFRFFAELTDFFSTNHRQAIFTLHFNGRQSVKHLIEAQGVPHTEVALIRVNGAPAGLSYIMQDGDRVEVYPISMVCQEDAGKILNGQAGDPRFLLDNHLGRLAVYLRMLGFDTLYRNDYQDEELARVAQADGRILLTRDRRLLMRSAVASGYWVRSKIPRDQLQEVVRRFDLGGAAAPFRRCLRCNGLLQPVDKSAVLDRLEPLTRRYFDDFHICPDCGQIYWRGSHYERMQKLVQEIQRSD